MVNVNIPTIIGQERKLFFLPHIVLLLFENNFILCFLLIHSLDFFLEKSKYILCALVFINKDTKILIFEHSS